MTAYGINKLTCPVLTIIFAFSVEVINVFRFVLFKLNFFPGCISVTYQDILVLCWHRCKCVFVKCLRMVFQSGRTISHATYCGIFSLFTSWCVNQNSENVIFPRCYFLYRNRTMAIKILALLSLTRSPYICCVTNHKNIFLLTVNFNCPLFSCLQCQAILTDWG